MQTGFTTREVAELACVPVRAVDKAIEEKVLTGISHVTSRGRKRRLLPPHAVLYSAIVDKLPVTLSKSGKRNLARLLAKRSPSTIEPLEIAPAVTVDVERLIGPGVGEKARRYALARQRYIEENDDILGGTPVIKGTRLTVYALRGRIDGGDSIEDIIDDYPHVDSEAIETAVLYARSHPLVGRPGGRPWKAA